MAIQIPNDMRPHHADDVTPAHNSSVWWNIAAVLCVALMAYAAYLAYTHSTESNAVTSELRTERPVQ